MGLEALQNLNCPLMSRESESEREERKILPTFKWNGVTFLFEWGFYILKEGNKMAEVDAIFPPFFHSVQSGLGPWMDNNSMSKFFLTEILRSLYYYFCTSNPGFFFHVSQKTQGEENSSHKKLKHFLGQKLKVPEHFSKITAKNSIKP